MLALLFLSMNSSLKSRIEEALSELRPHLQADGGDIEIIDIDSNGVVMLRFVGSCQSCPISFITTESIEDTIRRAAPEISSIIIT